MVQVPEHSQRRRLAEYVACTHQRAFPLSVSGQEDQRFSSGPALKIQRHLRYSAIYDRNASRRFCERTGSAKLAKRLRIASRFFNGPTTAATDSADRINTNFPDIDCGKFQRSTVSLFHRFAKLRFVVATSIQGCCVFGNYPADTFGCERSPAPRGYRRHLDGLPLLGDLDPPVQTSGRLLTCSAT